MTTDAPEAAAPPHSPTAALESDRTLVFEQPLNERMRTFLRLDFLYSQALYHNETASQWGTRAAVSSLIDILAIITRGDVRSDALKELERQLALLGEPGEVVTDSRVVPGPAAVVPIQQQELPQQGGPRRLGRLGEERGRVGPGADLPRRLEPVADLVDLPGLGRRQRREGGGVAQGVSSGCGSCGSIPPCGPPPA